jgi:ribosomal protein S18 acetylase RimI-like enzyme
MIHQAGGLGCVVTVQDDVDDVIIRDAWAAELAEVGELRVTTYIAHGFLSPESGYASRLRTLGADGNGTVLVAVPRGDNSRILGTVMLQPWPHAGKVVAGPGEAEIRALAVAPEGQGRGTGSALLRAVIERATDSGVRHLVLSTQQDMRTAHHLYEREGFRRLPERDWFPVPGERLLAYGMVLSADALSVAADSLNPHATSDVAQPNQEAGGQARR